MAYKKMNPEVKQKWIAALRSGQYKQGREMLRDINNKFCCLGVLCNIHAQEHPEFAATQKFATEYYGKSGALSDDLQRWANISDFAQSRLIAMNDSEKKSFNEIADWIEESL